MGFNPLPQLERPSGLACAHPSRLYLVPFLQEACPDCSAYTNFSFLISSFSQEGSEVAP